MTEAPQNPAAETGRGLDVAFLALFIGAIAIGASPILVRLSELGPFATAFWRVALALPLLMAMVRLEEGPGSRAWDLSVSFRSMLLPGVLFAGDLTFWHLSILKTSVANATLFANFSPVIVTAGAWIFLGERVSGRLLLGLGTAMIGAVVLIGDSFAFRPDHLAGDLYGLATAFFFGSYVLSVRSVRRRMSAARVMLGSGCVTAALLLAITIAFGEPVLPDRAQGWIALLALAWISHAGGQGLLAYALGHVPAGLSALVILVEPIAAAVLGWLVLAESIGPWQALGGAIVLAGIWFASRTRQKDMN